MPNMVIIIKKIYKNDLSMPRYKLSEGKCLQNIYKRSTAYYEPFFF